MKKNPGWKLELETIELVQEARAALKLQGNADVIALWAKQWKEGLKEPAFGMVVVPATKENPMLSPKELGEVLVKAGAVEEKPMAERVETPYQIARRERLEKLRAELARGAIAEVAESEGVNPAEIVLPFNVRVNDEPHQVIEFKGRRVLQRIVDGGPPIMMKNLTPQETVIYWNDRVKV